MRTFFIWTLIAIISSMHARGQTTYDWLNTAPDGNWKQGASGARWNPGGLWDEPPSGIIHFNNNHELSMTNNVSGTSGTYAQYRIIFGSSNTSNRTIGGNAVRLSDFSGTDPKIENLSSGDHTINFNLEGDGDPSDPLELNPVNGDLSFGGTINNQGSDILVYGDNGNSLNLNGVLSGSGKLVIKEYSLVKLGASNTYTGNSEIDEGEMWIESAGSIASGSSIFVGNGTLGSNVCKLFLTSVNGGQTFSNHININPGNSATRFIGSLNTSGTNTISGNIIRSSTSPVPELNIEVVNSGGSLSISGVINESSNVVKIGSGTASLTAQNTYTGLTTVTAGTLILNRSGGTTIPSTNNATINGGILRISSNQTLNNLTLSSGTLIVDNGVTLTINGTFSGGGTIENNGTIILVGPSAFPGSSTTITAMNNLQINRASGINLDKELTIAGTLTLSDGTIALGSNHITIGASGSIAGTFSAGEMIITDGLGSLRKNYSGTGSFDFPVGTSGAYTPVTLDFKSGTFSSAWASVRSIASKHPSNTSSTDYLNRYWDLDQSGISSFSCDISCTYDHGDVQGTESNIYAGKYSSGTWTPASSANTTTNTLTFTGATSFSDISGGELSALPVSLLDFTGKCTGDAVELTWSTASETNNSHFELERSEDADHYYVIARVEGAGNTQEIKNYSWTDRVIQPGKKYHYLLRQVDYDGREEVFGPWRMEDVCSELNAVKLFPQPAGELLQVSLNALVDGEMNLRILSMQGQIVSELGTVVREGSLIAIMDIKNIPIGAYLLEIEQLNHTKRFRFVKSGMH